MSRTTTGSSTHGTGLELQTIAAVVIGGTLLSGGRGTVTGTLLGVLIFTTLTNVFTLNNLSTSTQAVANGVIIVVDNFYSSATGGQDVLSSRADNTPGNSVKAPTGKGGCPSAKANSMTWSPPSRAISSAGEPRAITLP